MRRSAFGTAVLVVGAFGACTYYDDSLLAPTEEPSGSGGSGRGEGGSGAAGNAMIPQGGAGGTAVAGGGGAAIAGGGGASPTAGSSGGSNPACQLKRPPGKPSVAAGGAAGAAGGGDRDFTVAFREFDFGESTETTGYDLDGACTGCTCQGDTTARCLLPAMPTPGAAKDGLEGEDHGAKALLTKFSVLRPDVSSKGITKATENGDSTVLIRISGYNGLADDPSVRVAWYTANKLGKKPAWDGNDVWPVRAYGVMENNPDKPVYVDENGYVAGFVVVGGPKGPDKTSREVPLQISEDFGVKVTGAYLTGTITPSGTSFSLEKGTVAGKWGVEDVLRQLGSIKLGGVGICPDTPLYATIGKEVCAAADIGLVDTGSPTDPCNAISVGIGFRAEPAKLGIVAGQDPPMPACAPPFDPLKDGCGSKAFK